MVGGLVESNLGKLTRFAIVVVFCLTGCSEPMPVAPPIHNEQSEGPMSAGNSAILEEVNAAKLWFRAKKTRPIWVRLLEQDETVKTLEGDEQVPCGNYLCRGEAGDIWPQSAERLTAKYTLTEEIDNHGWRKCDPKPDASGVMAAQVSHAFQVAAKWGLLQGKQNDFIVKSFDDLDNNIPDDVWIVDSALFEATYERVMPRE